MPIKQTEYIPIPFAILLLKLAYTNNTLIVKNSANDLDILIKHFKNTFDFIILNEISKRNSKKVVEYELILNNKEKARNYLRKYISKLSQNKISCDYKQIPLWKRQFGNFIKKINNEFTPQDYKLYITPDNVYPILYGCANELIKVKDVIYKYISPFYDDWGDEESDIPENMIIESCVEAKATLDISKFIMKYTQGFAEDKSIIKYTPKQKKLLKLIEEKISQGDKKLLVTEIEKIMVSPKEDRTTRRTEQNVSENIRKFNIKYELINKRKIIGKRERNTNYYPLLF